MILILKLLARQGMRSLHLRNLHVWLKNLHLCMLILGNVIDMLHMHTHV